MENCPNAIGSGVVRAIALSASRFNAKPVTANRFIRVDNDIVALTCEGESVNKGA
jgi:hypothetical protein